MLSKLFTTFISAASASVLATSVSLAADLPNRKAPVVPYAPVFTWAGSYFGAHLGYMWGRTRVVDTGVLTETGAPTNGVIGGLLGGHNWQHGAWVYGLEIDGSLAGVHGTGTFGGGIPNKYDMTWAANLRARLGYSITPTMLLFAAGGVALAHTQFVQGAPGGFAESGATRVGWTIGAGLDYAFTRNFVGRVEYLYADYGSKTYTIAPGDWYQVGFKAQTARAALIWKF